MWQELQTVTSQTGARQIEIVDIHVVGLEGNPKSNGDFYTWGVVVLETDTGVYGIGETFRGVLPIDIVKRMRNTVIGQNPMDPERIAEMLERHHYTATGGIGQAAIAGIEMACWDIKGKVLNVPVYELLGGKYRDEVLLYSDSEAIAGESESIDFTAEYSPESYATAAREVVDQGFESLKFDLDVPTPGQPEEDRAARRLDNDGINHKVNLVEAVREEVGDSVDLGMDFHWSYSVETAMRLAKRLEPFDLAFIEDPVHYEKLDAQKRVKQAVDTPVLTGENLTSVEAFRDALDHNILDIAAPDVAMCGGLSELQKIAAVCDAYGVILAPHNLGSPVATIAGAHLGASVQNFYSVEFRGGDAPWWDTIVARTGGDGPIIKNGRIRVPEGPGLGIEFTAAVDDYVVTETDFPF